MTPIIYENVSQVAKRLKVSPSTVKKYYLLIESYNCYAFKRDERERVIFDDYDVRLLQRLVELKSMPQVTLEDACKLLLEEEGLTVKNTDMTVITPGSDDLKVLLKELKDTVELQQKQLQNQNEQIIKLTSLLESQQKLLDHSSAIEKQQVIDRDQAVMTVMRELQEVKQIVAASNEKKWYQFWK
ncbi:DUF3967 domain-containing protein [Bacillus pseudomycoides]|uniref:DUF3967 domain-containing protein n=1 Tax=Bacillus pseudomycoides TaxID=64104 RepID=A0A2B5U447_9BACI|nr:DUF3967 domain-containing protein [Bacillus pseudomycoides]PDY48124.1 hypothetical protein CON79_05995 [Bacillus pseudomycoides]PEA81553.1 hypothetical protein CON99_21935 [Bacillus pseudomycoides]PED05893.1 hypothetical protein COO19_24025 [Bacillus pseudomycoides]PED69999.1 hypothetical protein CON97_21960 [Bacillus pseudomycoides]PEI45428.1 hypothetical protein CN620_02925 [Bacillus pseudomycoides]